MTNDDIVQIAIAAEFAKGWESEDPRLARFSELVIANFLARSGKYVTNDASRQAAIAEAVAAEREACAAICEEHAADKNPPFKPHEDNYRDGWLDASNECGWAIRARSEGT